ncbi:hypothetical protein HOC32_00315, partial [Candidatus Woesearchaeota archaeon]|nr:hypothetical protein [Candidatus Woesearchaeota archaeon]
MISEGEKRLSYANELSEVLAPYIDSLLLVGSVAYNSEAVTTESDLDLVGIVDFKRNLPAITRIQQRLPVEVQLNHLRYLKLGQANMYSLVWNNDDFQIGLHLWGKDVLENVVELTGPNKYFKSTVKDVSTHERLISPTGKEYVIQSRVEHTDGTILDVWPCKTENAEVYFGTQVRNLLLRPNVLYDSTRNIETQLTKFKNHLLHKIATTYERPKTLDLAIGLPERIQSKLPI